MRSRIFLLPVILAMVLAVACAQVTPGAPAAPKADEPAKAAEQAPAKPQAKAAEEKQKEAVKELEKQAETSKELDCTIGKEHWRLPAPAKRGGTMARAMTNFEHLDVTGVRRGGASGLPQVYNSLMEFRGCFYEDIVLKPALAKSWKLSPDGLTLTLKLRDDVKWQNKPPVNGRAFTSADVAWTASYHVDNKTRYRSYFAAASIETPDDFTVVMKLSKADPDYIYKCCNYVIKIVPHEIFEEHGDFKTVAVGTGAWMLEDVRLNQEIKLAPNPDYYEKGIDGKPLPYLGEVRSFLLADIAAEVAALRARKLDMVRFSGVEAQDVPSLRKSNPNLRYRAQNRFSNSSLWFNLQKTPWNDVRVRQAARMSIDRKDIISSYGGQAGHAGYLPPAFDQYLWPLEKRKEMFKQDVEGAIKLMKEAGYSLDSPVKTEIKTGAPYQKQAEVVQQHLAAIGIEATIKVIGRSFTPILQKNKDSGDMELGWGNLGSQFFPGYWMGDVFETGSSANFPGVSDPELDKLAAAQRAATDPEKRKEIFLKIQDRLYELTPWVPTVGGHYQRFASCRMKNIPFVSPAYNPYTPVVGWIDETGC